MTTISPGQYVPHGVEYGDPDMAMHQTNGYAHSDSNESKSPLDRFGFLKNLTGDKKTTRDGQPPKRRGPKPDSKPALTRRQELNRQAQRTHRERKEMYIKALEQEVLRLKEVFGTTARERDAIAEENRRLKELLAAHGIHYDLSSPTRAMPRLGGSLDGSSAGSSSGTYAAGSASTHFTSPPPAMPGRPPPPVPGMPGDAPIVLQQPSQHGLDYDQIGIDFVLTLERPCMDHMQFLMVRSQDSTEEISGHALMATCPPESHIHAHPEEKYPHQMPPDIAMPDLVKLLDLSNRLPIDSGEITPIMAWAMILKEPRRTEFTKGDLQGMKGVLADKVRCYGFGAVIEEFEVRDVINNALAMKADYNAFH